MRLLDRFFNRSNQNVEPKPADLRIKTAQEMVREVWEAPALFNRKTRRAYGLLSKVWRWDLNGTDMQREFVPRYIRRHHAFAFTHHTGTRRVRRHRARILRVLPSLIPGERKHRVRQGWPTIRMFRRRALAKAGVVR